ncbi:MAG: phage holin family protein [Flavobacteriales bacterium]
MDPKFKTSILQMMITALALIVGDWWLDGVWFSAPWIALVAALILALLNAFVKPLLVFLTIPATIITFGLFLLVINAVIILIAKEIIPNNHFRVDGFWSAFWLSLIISIANSLFGGNVRVVRNNQQDLEN